MGQKIDLSFQVQGILPQQNLGIQLPMFADGETPAGTADGSNATFTLAQAPIPKLSLQLFVSPPSGGGAPLLIQTIDYTLAGKQITTTAPPVSGSNLRAWYRWNQSGVVIRFEIMTMADSVVTKFVSFSTYSDQLSMTEGFSFVLRPSQGLFVEKMYLSDAAVPVAGMPKSLSSTMSLSDGFAKVLA